MWPSVQLKCSSYPHSLFSEVSVRADSSRYRSLHNNKFEPPQHLQHYAYDKYTPGTFLSPFSLGKLGWNWVSFFFHAGQNFEILLRQPAVDFGSAKGSSPAPQSSRVIWGSHCHPFRVGGLLVPEAIQDPSISGSGMAGSTFHTTALELSPFCDCFSFSFSL